MKYDRVVSYDALVLGKLLDSLHRHTEMGQTSSPDPRPQQIVLAPNDQRERQRQAH